ncbi:grf-like transcription factor isoform B [Micractinium conductrix]|uniref:Grf-like transcription factor isoform A n=1 Tax=Micractinium conductrix TaxID=554055 RepID=A0A2P6V6V1_9CHLO|nr:grf-like transcription factor isoform A [Micractinium conductrix]PSC69810.1 grf-like transcription factor isoform B [Micractinium conductrix]|eukprot:PSC69809.1 grf-like transcription factor isoform A [Micractinium conductrix]
MVTLMPLPAALALAPVADLNGLCLSPTETTPAAALSCDGSSLDSSGSELDVQQQHAAAHEQHAAEQQQQQQSAALAASCGDALLPPEQRTHHLLKHCLSQSQRSAALQHFNTADAREAAKEIARMGQRELQAKFKEVYGSATKSNNNSWLRRKLYEAVGVAPLKANTKGKARKSAAASHRKSGGGKSRSLKLAVVKVKHEPVLQLGLGLPHGTPALPGGMSILDLHHSSGLLSADTSDSEDGSASHGYPASLHHSAPGTPRSSNLGLPFNVAACFGASMHQAPPPPPPGFVPVAEPSSPMACGMHWADGGFASVQQPPGAFLVGGSTPAMPTLDSEGLAAAAGLPASTFKPMDLEQDAAALWAGGDCPSQWYFGSMELGAAAAPGGQLPPMEGLAMDCCGSAATAACACVCEEEEVPLLTLDLGAIDVSI